MFFFFTGTCFVTSNTTSNCACADGWKDSHCETKIDYCFNITCQNRGVCRPLVLDYKCECLHRYSGRYCERKGNQSSSINSSVIMSMCITLLLLIINFT
jgi:hypothetical protein